MTKPLLVFIGRQYHSKTQSDGMILSLLREHFETEVIRREQYTDQELVEKINKSNPSLIFYWCLPPSTTKQLWKIKCKNVVWAPMWDGFRALTFRKRMLLRFSKVKVLCFSKALYRYFSKIKMPCQYWQCALKPQFKGFKANPPYTIFLWQREKMIGLGQIVELIGEKNIKKILYKSEIGTIEHKKFSFEIEKLKDWMEPEEYRRKIDEADFYVAPRKAEGIGFSFLEAMSYGKVILAYDESTMNEYIEDGENGYLFDETFTLRKVLQSPDSLSGKMKRKADQIYYRWEKTKGEIIPFLLRK